MSIQKTLGGDRLGSGNKQKLALHNYERSNHNMGYIWRSTMSPGTLIPFLNEVGLPGDTFDIKLDCDIKTHPTIGPLFGSFKVQLDIFLTPIRCFHRELNYDKLGIGNNMKNIFLPILPLKARQIAGNTSDLDNCQVNPSSILSYLGIRGIGYNTNATEPLRNFNAVPFLNYWDIVKNYYSNKQENIGAVIHSTDTVIDAKATAFILYPDATSINKAPSASVAICNFGDYIQMTVPSGQTQNPNHIIFNTTIGERTLAELFTKSTIGNTATIERYDYNWTQWGNITIYNWKNITQADFIASSIKVTTFPLSNIDLMREAIHTSQTVGSPYNLATFANPPYSYITADWGPNIPSYQMSQEGLALKTYQSDLFNNWLSKTTFDNITNLSSISTAGGSFTIDTLLLAKKVHNLLNRIMVSGGSYQDWLQAAYGHDPYTRINSPVYQGGLIKELIFQEVVSNSQAIGEDGNQPLGTLAGKGVMGNKHKGGYVHVKVDEPSYIMGIISLTPRLDYSQGNKWDTTLQTIDDLHKPGMDQIGFQDLITEQMAWWSTYWNGTTWIKQSAGKQPAWLNYMTNVNQTRGNFAVKVGGAGGGEMFMTLNRAYEPTTIGQPTMSIKDLTTYIDPVKYNQIFASTSIDSQNFWAQIAVDIEARRKISAKVMPDL